ncbi:MAG: CRR6 family NdhI maturation factor [Thermosynechococcaceae cyanobacterium]
MPTVISVNRQHLETLDLSPVQTVLKDWIDAGTLFDHAQDLQFRIDYPQDPNQVQLELPDIPDVRLWFIRLDSEYPWLPYWLDWRSGELARYAAMMVPHSFSESEGIQYNPQALDIFIMGKVFTLHHWLTQHGIDRPNSLKQMAELFGYDLNDALFELLR